MKKIYTPKTIIFYLIKEFNSSILIFFSIFISLVLLSNFIEEIIFFRDKEIQEELIIKAFLLSLFKTPTIIISMMPFIFLFSGIFFFAKLIRVNEITPMSLSGFSKIYISSIPAVYSFIIGMIIIVAATPIVSELAKYYEASKQKYSNNENLIVMSNTGLWIKEKTLKNTYLIRTDQIKDQNFTSLKNISIYKFDNNNNFIQRIDGNFATIEDKKWKIPNATINANNEITKISNLNYITTIDFKKIKSFFTNPDIYSFWNILKEQENMQNMGYYGQELIIKFNKYLSLPIMLFSMVIISTIFTINLNYRFNNFGYAFIGILTGIFFYFLGDLSIAIGKSGKLPLVLSVWVPTILIMTISIFSLISEKE